MLAFTLAVDSSGDATREVLFNVGHWLRWLLYLSGFVLLAVVATGPLRKAKLWRLGRHDEQRWDRVGERLKVFAFYGIGQGKLTNDLYAGLMHLFIFWGWVVLFIGTIIIAIHADVVYFLEGRVYLAYSAVLDLFGVIALIGLSMALWRRYVMKPPRMRLGSLWDDEMLLWLMFAIVVSGFLIEGLRIGATELISGSIEAHGAAFLNDLGIAQNQKEIVANPDWAPWSPVGYALAKLFDGLGISTATMLDVHKVIWWLHLPLATLWVAWVGYGKISHIILGSGNIFMRNLSMPKGIIAGSTLAPIKDFETAESFGSGYVADFSWKQLMDTDVCVRCGRCEVNCPATISGKELSPMQVMQDLRAYLHEIGPSKLEQQAKGEKGAIENERVVAGDVISVNTIWDCVTCGACETQCPVMIEHIGTLQDMRRYRVLTEGDMPPTAQAVMGQLEQRGHPWRGTNLTRTTWMEDLDVEVPEFDGSQDYLYWVGCSGALVERNVPITRAVARLLTEAGVSWGCLGEAETCTGDPARRMGNEYLAQMQMQAHDREPQGQVGAEDHHELPPLLQHPAQRVRPVRGRVRRLPPHPASRRPRRGGQADAEARPRPAGHLPRLLLPRPSQRRVRGAAQAHRSPAQRHVHRNAAQPEAELLLRRRWRSHVRGRDPGQAHQPPARRRSPEHRRRHRRHQLPVLRPDVRRRHRGRRAGRIEARQGDGPRRAPGADGDWQAIRRLRCHFAITRSAAKPAGYSVTVKPTLMPSW